MYPKKLEQLVFNLSKLPGVGSKTAQRLALWMMKQKSENIAALATSMLEARQAMSKCPECSNISQNEEVCGVCRNLQRDHKTICVVADPRDVIAIEAAKEYRGVYHVLGGVISPIDGIGPDQLTILQLQKRAAKGVDEIILAIPASIEGQTTALYIGSLLRACKITQIVYGLAVGSELEYADPVSLAKAFEGRRILGST